MKTNAPHLDVHGSKLERRELVLARGEFVEKSLFGEDTAARSNGRPVVGVGLLERVDVERHHRVPDMPQAGVTEKRIQDGKARPAHADGVFWVGGRKGTRGGDDYEPHRP
jgi:hypothetical protein